MPTVSGSFSCNVNVQTAIALSDQSNHDLGLAEISGIQTSSDENFNNASMTYWGITDLVDGRGTQRGYFANVHGHEVDRDWGTFEGKVATKNNEVTVEGTFQFTGGSGKFKGITGNGTFHTKMTSPRTLEGSWQGVYTLGTAKAHAH